MSRRRPLTDDEESLWQSVVRLIKPLRSTAAPAPQTPKVVSREREKPAQGVPRAPAPPATSEAAKLLPIAPFDRRLKQRIARGRDEISARIDLHGLTQSEAHTALLRFLRRAQADDARIVLVVTGKGGRSRGIGGAEAERSEHGVLRRKVPQWLAMPEFRTYVLSFDEAHAGHGGQGALYVRLRRAR